MYPLLPFSLNQPLAVDNAISTIGVIHKLIKKINEVIEEVNSIDSKSNEYTDEQIRILDAQLRTYIDELNAITINHFEIVETDILTNKNNIQNLDLRQQQLEQSMFELQGEFSNLAISVNERINNVIQSLKSYVDLQIEIVKELINAQNPEIIDCFGHKNKLQTAYNNMFDALMYSNGGGTFEKVLNKIKTFVFSTYVDMQNVSFYSFVTAMANTPSHNRIVYYLSYSYTNLTIYTQKLASFKDLITNIDVCVILLYKYGMFNGVPISATTDFQNTLRNEFFVLSQYEPVTFNPTFNTNLR